MSAHIMTALAAKKDGPGSREIKATFRGPNLVAPENGYDVGGSVLDLTSKPAAAAPAADAASTSSMLYNVARSVKAEPSTAALTGLWQARYVPAAAGAPATGLMQVFTPAVITYAATATRASLIVDGGAAVAYDIIDQALPANHRVVGARIYHNEVFDAGATPLATMVLTIGVATGTNEFRTALNVFTAGDPVGLYHLDGATAVAGMNQPAAIVATMTADINLDTMGVGTGAITVEIDVVDNGSLRDIANWNEVAAGTDLGGVTFTVEAEGL